MNQITNQYTLGEFLSGGVNHDVAVPLIQRDYAQGRIGKGYIRKKFLKQIFEVADDRSGKKLTLDFIYGYSGEDTFYPLDGQQRVTTLWLVYWFLAYMSETLHLEKENLLRFTYETRESSREFCKAMCDNILPKKSNGIVQLITDQTWFLSKWKEDPTINAMLRTIGGEKDDDGIEPLWNRHNIKQKRNFERHLNNLKNNISFYVLRMGDDQLCEETADQLYVKMNARGKSLTEFENFKADMVSYLKTGKFKGMAKQNTDLSLFVASKIDNKWNDVFWDVSSADQEGGKTDEIFFSFLNRYFANLVCLEKGSDGEYLSLDGSLSEKMDYFGIKDDGKFENISYEEFDHYAELLSIDNVNSLIDTFECLVNNYREVESVLSSLTLPDSNTYSFVPKYLDDLQTRLDKSGNRTRCVKSITLPGRLYFFAVCKYLEKANCQQWNSDKFREWVRFCRNIIENSSIDNDRTMVYRLRDLNEISVNCLDIRNYLISEAISDQTDKYHKQLNEEIEKARKMNSDPTFVSKIEEAEDKKYASGTIAYLFTNDQGNVCWNDFDTKFNRLSCFFADGQSVCEFAKKYAHMFADFEDVKDKLIFHNIPRANRGDSWIDVLNDPDEHERVHKILTGTNRDVAIGSYKKFVDSRAFELLVSKANSWNKPNLRVALYSNKYALFKKSDQKGKLVFDDANFRRNEFLSALETSASISVELNQKLDGNYYFGDEIKFNYQSGKYIWTSDNKIYKTNADWKAISSICVDASQINGTVDLINAINNMQ